MVLNNKLHSGQNFGYFRRPFIQLRKNYEASFWHSPRPLKHTVRFFTPSVLIPPHYPNRICDERKCFASGLAGLQHPHGPMEEEVGVGSIPAHGATVGFSGTSESTVCSNPGSIWIEEAHKLVEIKRQISQDGKRSKMFADCNSSNSNGFTQRGNLQSAVGQGYIDHGQLKAHTQGPPYISSVQEQILVGEIGCEMTTDNYASNMLAYNEKVQSSNMHISLKDVNGTATHHSSKVVHSNGSTKPLEGREETNFILSHDRVADAIENSQSDERSVIPATGTHAFSQLEAHRKLSKIYGKVLVVDDISVAKRIVEKLTTQYKHLVHACDTEACVLLKLQIYLCHL